MSLRLEILGSQKMVDKFHAAGALADQAAAAGAYNVGLAILRPAIRNAPKLTGVLRSSGYVSKPVKGICTVGFGGPAKAYAWVQHERLDFKHKEGGAKYLERAVNEIRPRAGDIFLRIVRAVLLRGQPVPPFTGAPDNPFAVANAKAKKARARAKAKAKKASARARAQAKKKAVKAVGRAGKAVKKAAGKAAKRAGKAGAKAGHKAAKAGAKAVKRAGKAGSRAVKKAGKVVRKAIKKARKPRRRRK